MIIFCTRQAHPGAYMSVLYPKTVPFSRVMNIALRCWLGDDDAAGGVLSKSGPTRGPILPRVVSTHHFESITEDPGHCLANVPPKTRRISQRPFPPFGLGNFQGLRHLSCHRITFVIFVHYKKPTKINNPIAIRMYRVMYQPNGNADFGTLWTDGILIETGLLSLRPAINNACVSNCMRRPPRRAQPVGSVQVFLPRQPTHSPKKNAISQYLRSDRCLSVLDDCAQSHQS
jgi:hypothetical protein